MTKEYHLTYEEFAKWFSVLREFRQQVDQRHELLSKMYPECNPIDDLGEKMFEAYTQMLSIMMEDSGEWIDYYIWEAGMGEEDRSVIVDGTKWPLRTVEDLYRIMTL